MILIEAKKRYDKGQRYKWILIAIIAMFLNVAIYSGLNRSDFILLGIASVYTFCFAFPKYRKVVILFFIVILAIVLPTIAEIRGMTFIGSEKGIIFDVTYIMWGYLGGPYNVAIAIEAAELYGEGRNLFNFIYDFARPTLGLNLLVKNLPLHYSNEYFNYRMYLTDRVVQIMPMVGEGYFYFGLLGSPIITIIFTKLAYFLSRIHEQSYRIELIYFLTITCTRLGFIMGQNATIQMNDLSFNLFVPLIIIWLNRKIKI